MRYVKEFYENNSCTETPRVSQHIGKDDDGSDFICSFGIIKSTYLPYHGGLSIIVCFFGALTNLMNIIVLTYKEMRTNHINLILTGIAVADLLLSVEYIPFAIHMYLLEESTRDSEEMYSLPWGIFVLFHTNFTIIIHTVSVCLTLSLALWRLCMIQFPTESVRMCTLPRCKAVLTVCYGMYYRESRALNIYLLTLQFSLSFS